MKRRRVAIQADADDGNADVCHGLAIQAQTGASLSEVLTNLAGVIRARFRLKRKDRGVIVGGDALSAIDHRRTAHYRGFVAEDRQSRITSCPCCHDDRTGNVLLCRSGGIWMSIGILVMRQMINFKGESAHGRDLLWNSITGGNMVLFLAVLFTFLSAFGLIYPFLNRIEARENYKRIIAEQRKSLFERARQEDQVKIDLDTAPSTKDSLTTLFKLEKLAGAKAARALLIQAGYRHPKSLLVYLLSRLILPTGLLLLAFFFVQNIDKPIKDSVKLLIMFGIAWFGYFIPYLLVKNNGQKRQEEIQVTFPDALDMMLICVQGGISIESAINRIATYRGLFADIGGRAGHPVGGTGDAVRPQGGLSRLCRPRGKSGRAHLRQRNAAGRAVRLVRVKCDARHCGRIARYAHGGR
jgi:Flp pilus assembly protein TadB